MQDHPSKRGWMVSVKADSLDGGRGVHCLGSRLPRLGFDLHRCRVDGVNARQRGVCVFTNLQDSKDRTTGCKASSSVEQAALPVTLARLR